MRAIFIGGVLDGQEREIAGSRDYIVPIYGGRFTADGSMGHPWPTQTYRRSRLVRSNKGQLSHVEMRLLELK